MILKPRYRHLLFSFGLAAASMSCLAESNTDNSEAVVDKKEISQDKKSAMSFSMEYTAVQQSLISGSDSISDQYSGKWDAFLNLDTSRVGLWQGGQWVAHLEYNHGDAGLGRGKTILPTNTAPALPLGAPKQIEATSFYLAQKISDSTSMLIGKINVLDLLAKDLFFGGWGNHRFMNVAFVAPPSGVLPPTIIGVIANVKTDDATWTFMLYDPNDKTSDYSLNNNFSDGISGSISRSFSTQVAGRKTNFSMGATYTNKEGADLNDILLPPDLESGTKKGSYSVNLQVSHFLSQAADGSDDLGLYLKLSLADGNPNAIEGSLIGGIGGKGIFNSRPQDTFGVGYFYYAFSNQLRDALEPAKDFDDEQGIEVFYNYQINQQFYLTADLQLVDPAEGIAENAVIGGLRLNIRF